jgi:hypothetical protein
MAENLGRELNLCDEVRFVGKLGADGRNYGLSVTCFY